MGVHNLWSILSPSACKVSMEEIRGLRIGVDTSIWICQFLSQATNRVKPQVLVLRGFFHRILKLLSFRIKPIFIFDGQVPEVKRRTVEYRRKIMRDQTKRIKGLAKKAFRRINPSKNSKKKKTKKTAKSIVPVSGNLVLPPPPPVNTNVEETHVFSFALPGKVTGEVDFDDDEDLDDDEFEEREEIFQETVDQAYEGIIRDGKATKLNFFDLEDEVKREVYYLLKSAVYEQYGEIDLSTDVILSPSEFSNLQRKEFIDEERNRERMVLKSIMLYENKSKENEKNVISKGVMQSNPHISFRIEKDKKIKSKIVEEEEEEENIEKKNQENKKSRKKKKVIIIDDEDEDEETVSKENININSGELDNHKNNSNNQKEDESENAFFGNFFENEEKNNKDTKNLLSELDELIKSEESRIIAEEIEELIFSSDEEKEEISSNSNSNSNIENSSVLEESENLRKKEFRFPFEITGSEEKENENKEVEEVEGEFDSDEENMEFEVEDIYGNLDLMIRNELQVRIKELLKLMGIPFVQSPFEADSQCGFLFESKLIDAVVTQDSDMFLFGVGKVFKYFFSRKREMEMYDMKLIQEQLGLSKTKMIQLAYLLGSDYTDGINNIGIVHSMEILDSFCRSKEKEDTRLRESETQEVSNILEGLKEFQKWVNSPTTEKPKKKKDGEKESSIDQFKRKYFKARNRFKSLDEERHNTKFPNIKVAEAYLKPVVNRSKQQFHWTSLENISMGELCKFGSRFMSMSKDEIKKFVEPVKRNRKLLKGRQKEIGTYFPRKMKKVAYIQSKRLKKAVTSLKRGKLVKDRNRKKGKDINKQKKEKKKKKKRKRENQDEDVGESKSKRRKMD